ncbi:S24 family peptidase [Deinococcus sp.]|uniref:LexA family protein n=1 Tax=Deinococcus sp. TaxID=47478 RepID=UPI0025D60941|nr:S24 family peptidase [Deinococcus sp.]
MTMTLLDDAPRQRTVLLEIARLDKAGQVVTTERLSSALNMPRQNVRRCLLALQDKHLIRYEAGERQSAHIQLSGLGRGATGQGAAVLRLPILGDVAAGQPTVAEQFIEGYATRLQDVLDVHDGDFLLRVRGDSMIGVGIYPGDLVVIRPMQEEPHSGEIVLVLLPDEERATLKRWHRLNGTVSLGSENPQYPPMILKAVDVQIQGCLVGHIGIGRARRTPDYAPRGR